MADLPNHTHAFEVPEATSEEASDGKSINRVSFLTPKNISDFKIEFHQIRFENNGLAIGKDSSVDTDKEVISVGSDTIKRKIINVGNGENDTDAVTLGQLNKLKSELLDLINKKKDKE